MHGNYENEDSRAISSNAPICSRATIRSADCKDVQDPLWFGLLCRSVWPAKAWLMLQQVCGCKERVAYNYASGDCPRADVLRDILRSEYGYLALKWMMREEPPAWWMNGERQREIGEQVEGIVGRSVNELRGQMAK